jgi:NADPH-dependent curcumin reductase CurA
MPTVGQRIVLAAHPVGEPTKEDFRFEAVEVPDPPQGQVLLRSQFLSLDPYVRGRISGVRSYAEPTALGDPPPGDAVCEVVASNDASLTAGDTVLADIGWQTHALARAADVRRLDPSAGVPVTTALGILGMPGLTAYSGLYTIGKPAAGETVVVAAATGPVGSLVGQLARIKGARVVGIAGGPSKREYLRSELDFDEALDHRAPDFADRLAAATPDGVDIYFENVGGKVFNAVFARLNTFGRIPVCGLVSSYNAVRADSSLPDGLFRSVLTKSLTIRGFIVEQFWDEQFDRFQIDVGQWIREGKIRYREHIVEGFANTPDAFSGMLRGENFGKLIIRVEE